MLDRPQQRQRDLRSPRLDSQQTAPRPRLLPREDRPAQHPQRTANDRLKPTIRNRPQLNRTPSMDRSAPRIDRTPQRRTDGIARPDRNARQPLSTFDHTKRPRPSRPQEHKPSGHRQGSGHHGAGSHSNSSTGNHVTNINNINNNVTNITNIRHKPYIVRPKSSHRSRRHSSSIWFSFHFSSGYTPWCYGSSWYTPSWHRPKFFVSYCPTWWYPTWHPVYVRPLARPVYYTAYQSSFYTTYYTAPAMAAPMQPRELCGVSQREAWNLLAVDRVHEALEAFACLAREHRYDSLPHIGYALANALVDADESAVAIMRHAVQFDAEALRYIPADDRIDQQLHVLLQFYGELAAHPGEARDALFMIASLRTILNDHAGAYFAVTESISHGGRDNASAALRTMLAAILAEQMHQAQ